MVKPRRIKRPTLKPHGPAKDATEQAGESVDPASNSEASAPAAVAAKRRRYDVRDTPRKPEPSALERVALAGLIDQVNQWGGLAFFLAPSEMTCAALDLLGATYLALLFGTQRELEEGRRWARIMLQGNRKRKVYRTIGAAKYRALGHFPSPFPRGFTTWFSLAVDARGKRVVWGETGRMLRANLRLMQGHSKRCIAQNMALGMARLFTWLPTAATVWGEYGTRLVEWAAENKAMIDAAQSNLKTHIDIGSLSIVRTIAKEFRWELETERGDFWTSEERQIRFVRRALIAMGFSPEESESIVKMEKRGPTKDEIGRRTGTWPKIKKNSILTFFECRRDRVCPKPVRKPVTRPGA